MENASKALIIAGAILIAILLISVAIMVINSTSGVTDQVGSQMDSLTIQQFNAKFDPYIGSNKNASDVRGLIAAILASNGSNTTHQVAVSSSGFTTNITKQTAASELAKITGNLETSKKYTITVTGSSNGYYNEITITKNS